jgi:hypothetical protein
MRNLTTDWNNAAYSNETVFVDKLTGNAMTIPANKAHAVRAMFDSVQAGAYLTNVDSISADPDAIASAEDDEDTVTVTVQFDGSDVAGFPVKANSDDTDVATVAPLFAYTNADGEASFVITSVAAGSATITFTAGTNTDTTAVTVS